MKLRGRLVLTVLLISVPVSAGLAFLFASLRQSALLDSVYETTVARMEDGGRERCERVPVGRRGRGRAMRMWRARRERRIYDEAFRPSTPDTPLLEPELQRALSRGEPVAAQWLDGRPRRVRIAMRMPWSGPCAVVVIERPAGPLLDEQNVARSVLWSLIIASVTALIALFAMGPLVRRLRRLASSVRAQASGGYAKNVEVDGSDEVAELARAFNEASAEIRTRLSELSSRDRALTDFLGNTTHDVMVPLTVLQGHLSDLSLAAREGRALDHEKLRAALEETHYLGALIRNLAAAARLEAGEPMLARHSMDLGALVERVMARHAPIARERSVDLAHAVPEAKLEVIADSTLAEQALSNLVHNAIRYNRPGGHVAVVLEQEHDRFTLSVTDDGPGIPPEELAHVSERRFRGGEARQRRPTGLGLGLHIVRDVAERHRWSLDFESPPDGGLRVTLGGTIEH
jgi:signal transduction histidine kinase